MVPSHSWSRRRFLATLGMGVAGLAGCEEPTTTEPDPGPSEGPEGTATETPATTRENTQSSTAGGDSTEASRTTIQSTPTTDAADTLDRREANVVGVEIESVAGGTRFSVTLNHDDNGEEGYANWWQVERLDGTRLGRRELRHAHSDQPFTRSKTISVPDDVSCVVVRGHDQTHGYGGRAITVTVESGATASVDQGTDRESISESDCP